MTRNLKAGGASLSASEIRKDARLAELENLLADSPCGVKGHVKAHCEIRGRNEKPISEGWDYICLICEHSRNEVLEEAALGIVERMRNEAAHEEKEAKRIGTGAGEEGWGFARTGEAIRRWSFVLESAIRDLKTSQVDR